jgi:hypothetical protein
LPVWIHRENDAALDRFHPIASIGNGTVLNNVLGVNAKTIAHQGHPSPRGEYL